MINIINLSMDAVELLDVTAARCFQDRLLCTNVNVKC